MKYPNGKDYKQNTKVEKKTTRGILNAGNRGMNFESDINQSNAYYNENNICLITKRPTPIIILKVRRSQTLILKNNLPPTITECINLAILTLKPRIPKTKLLSH